MLTHSSLLMLTPEEATDAAIAEGSDTALKALTRFYAAKAAHTLLHGSGTAQRHLLASLRCSAVRVMSESNDMEEQGTVYANRLLGIALVLIAPH